MAVLKLLLTLTFVHLASAKGSKPVIECTPELLKVTIPMDGDRRISYLEGLKDYKPCQPELKEKVALFLLDLQDPSQCGVTRVLNTMTGKRTYYHKIVIENSSGDRETVAGRCEVLGKQRITRDVHPFPLDFDEPDVLNITRYEVENAPEPVIGALVKQNGKQVSGEISVTPGTPLTMEIFLNEESAPIYGLLVNYMHVTDTGKLQETIILNGCSVDPYLFDNFVTTDGDTLSAKFKAFKFPDTSYVQFQATVTVCLDKCQGVQCTNGQVAYGRKRRAIEAKTTGKMYEVSLTTLIKVDENNGTRQAGFVVVPSNQNFKVENQLGDTDGTPATVSEQTSNNETTQVKTKDLNNCNMPSYNSFLIILACLILLFK